MRKRMEGLDAMCGEEIKSCSGNCSGCAGESGKFCPEKQEIRSGVRFFLEMMDEKTHSSASAAINGKLSSIVEKGSFSSVAAFVPVGKEPDVTPFLKKMLADGKRLFLPRSSGDGEYEMAEITSDKDLVNGRFGILEPSSSAPVPDREAVSKALWIVPGIAFDSVCRRLGRGKGFYDRLLAKYEPSLAAGVFFSCQKVAEIPSEPHDRSLDCVITEETVLRNASYTEKQGLF